LLGGVVFLGTVVFSIMLPTQPVPIEYVELAALQLVIGTLSWPYIAVLGGHARFDRVAAVELGAGLAGTATLLIAIALRGGVVEVMMAQVLAAGIAVIVARGAAAPFIEPNGAPPVRVVTLLRQAAPFGAVAAVQSLYTRIDILLLGQMATTFTLGLYSVAYKPTNMLVFFGSTVAVALFPLMAQAPQSVAPVAFRRAMKGLGVVGPAMALALSGLAGPLLQALYGSEYVEAAPILVVLAWSAVLNWLYSPLGATLQARGQERWWLASLTGGLLLNAAGNLWAIPRWGALGSAVAMLVSEAMLLAIGAVLVGRGFGMLPSPKPVLIGLGATIMGGLALGGLQAMGAMVATMAALITYGGILVLFRMVTAEDVSMTMGWFWERSVVEAGSQNQKHRATEQV